MKKCILPGSLVSEYLGFFLLHFSPRLFGPRKKMMNAIARWHSKARPALGDLEQAYADRLEGEMQEMGVQLQMVNQLIFTLKCLHNTLGFLRL